MSETIRVVYHGAPVSQNAAYLRSRQGRMYLSAPAVAYKRDLALCARLAMQGRPPIEGPYAITIRPFFPSRRFDLASVEKLTSDALQGIVVTNDRNARRIVLEWGLDRERPRIEIEVAPFTKHPRSEVEVEGVAGG